MTDHNKVTKSSAITDNLKDQILVALATRQQLNANERMISAKEEYIPNDFIKDVSEIAKFENWEVSDNDIDEAVRDLLSDQCLAVDQFPEPGSKTKYKARLSTKGYARAIKSTQNSSGEPLARFKRDIIFDDEGIGQIEIPFMDQKYVIGCIKGEEDRAIEFAHRFEVNVGEVTKAVGGIDHTRAMIMAGIISEEFLEERDKELARLAPASDRLVTLNHNSPDYTRTMSALSQLIDLVETSNLYRQDDPADQERRAAELEAGRRLLSSKTISTASIRGALFGALTYLAAKFADAPIGEAATAVWNALKVLLGL